MSEVEQDRAVSGTLNYLDSIAALTRDRVACCDKLCGPSWNKLGFRVSLAADDFVRAAILRYISDSANRRGFNQTTFRENAFNTS